MVSAVDTTAPSAPAAPAPRAPGAPPPPPPPKPKTGVPPRMLIPQAVPLDIKSGVDTGAQRILIHGVDGIGKTTLAAYLPAPLFIDTQDGTKFLNVSRITDIDSWDKIRGIAATIAQSPPEGVRTIVLDNTSDAERLACDKTVITRTTRGGSNVSSVEEFGWNEGWRFVYDEFLALLSDFDRIRKHGINVCVISHSFSTPIASPIGEYMRWEPLLYGGDRKGKASIRDAVVQWADHVVFIGYDVAIDGKTGRAVGGASRSLWTLPMPMYRCKAREAQMQTSMNFDLNDPDAIWRLLKIS